MDFNTALKIARIVERINYLIMQRDEIETLKYRSEDNIWRDEDIEDLLDIIQKKIDGEIEDLETY